MSENLLLPYHASQVPGSRSVLVLAPHADDEIFGCGGALALHAQAGARITIVVLTDGAARTPEGLPIEAEIERRAAESRQAAMLMGLTLAEDDLQFWRLPDRGLEYGEVLIERLRAAILACDADLVYAPSLFEAHPDHRVTAMAAVEALRRLGGERRLALYEVGMPGRPNLLVDITLVLDKKRAAMRAFASQLTHQRYDEQIEALNRYRAYTLPREVVAAEAFELLDAPALQRDALALFASEHHRRRLLDLPAEGRRDLPLVSVIIRSTDRPTLAQALDSIAVQTYPHLEVVLVNALGAAHRLPEGHCGRFALRWIDVGRSLTRSQAANAGLAAAQGEYLMFLDDDDWLDADHLARLVAAVSASERRVRAAYSGVRTMTEQGEGYVFNHAYDRPLLFSGNYIPIHAVLFHRSLVEQDGCRFDDAFEVYEDWDFWLQVASKTTFTHVDAVTANYRIVESSGFGVTATPRAQEEGKRQCYRKWRARLSEDEWYEVLERVYRCLLLDEQIADERKLQTALRQEIAELHGRIGGLQGEREALRAELEERDRQLRATQWILADRSGLLAHRELELKQHSAEIAQLRGELVAWQGRVNELTAVVRGREGELATLRDRLNATIHAYEASSSWQLTAPLRLAGRLARRLIGVLRRLTLPPAHVAVVPPAAFPAPVEAVPPVVEQEATQEIQVDVWQQIAEAAKPAADFQPLDDEKVEADDCRVKLIAFYLPQFHPIPENDAWWGKGFTEWTNVSKALPQFVGHEQPRHPGELGFYDLRLPEVMHRQIELAKQYGLQGFCFHYYWFGGKRLLEKPLDNFLADATMDFPFCICWANENWTRRWDGMEEDVLISQVHSEDNDNAFIDAVIPLFRDRRYIRIAGRPLLIVYRTSLLPDARHTAELWRQRFRDVGIGEIQLVMAQCFNDSDPVPYGFDAAVEFPPHHVGTGIGALPKINERFQFFSADFRGNVHEYPALLDRQDVLPVPDYPLFKTVFPGWDNTARRGEAASLFAGATPAHYRAWLAECCRQALEHPVDGESIVFINAWNEWAEGAYLEPDRRHGYAYLAATRDVMREFSRRKAARLAATQNLVRSADTAVVLHLYYPELWWEISSHLRRLPMDFDLYVTLGPQINEQRIIEILTDFPRARLFQWANRGRDVLPFIEILRRIAPLGYRRLCKLHSKKSLHRSDGDDWRRRNLDGLLGATATAARIEAALSAGDIGIVCAPGQIYRSEEFWGSNKARVQELLKLAGLPESPDSLDFVAGTMFWCRLEALAPLLRLPADLYFEPEKGQLDGTLAHAIERFLSIAAQAEGWKVVEVDELG